MSQSPLAAGLHVWVLPSGSAVFVPRALAGTEPQSVTAGQGEATGPVAPGSEGQQPAQPAGTAQPAGSQPAGRPATDPSACYVQLLMILGLFAILYFLMIRPQQKQEKERRAMLGAIQKGDQVVTNGGIHAQVVSIEERTATLKFGSDPGQRFKVDRSAIARVEGRKEKGA